MTKTEEKILEVTQCSIIEKTTENTQNTYLLLDHIIAGLRKRVLLLIAFVIYI